MSSKSHTRLCDAVGHCCNCLPALVPCCLQTALYHRLIKHGETAKCAAALGPCGGEGLAC